MKHFDGVVSMKLKKDVKKRTWEEGKIYTETNEDLRAIFNTDSTTSITEGRVSDTTAPFARQEETIEFDIISMLSSSNWRG